MGLQRCMVPVFEWETLNKRFSNHPRDDPQLTLESCRGCFCSSCLTLTVQAHPFLLLPQPIDSRSATCPQEAVVSENVYFYITDMTHDYVFGVDHLTIRGFKFRYDGITSGVRTCRQSSVSEG